MSNELLVINVLPRESFNDCHINGSVHVPLTRLAEYAKSLDRNREIVVYCTSYVCSASREAWQLLKDMGFLAVFAYEGGMAEWFQKGLPSMGACKAEYLTKKHHEPTQVGHIQTISAQELEQKMQLAGLL